MQITQIHIGTKLTFGNRKGYIIPLKINIRENVIEEAVVANENGQLSMEKDFSINAEAIWPWRLYEKDDTAFDYSLFGCNDDNVRQYERYLITTYGLDRKNK